MRKNQSGNTIKFDKPFTNWKPIYSDEVINSWHAFLSGETVHIWHASLDENITFPMSLSLEEQILADAFQNVKDQNRYKRTHALLRIILACYVGESHKYLRFDKNRYGKPFLYSDSGSPEIKFNMTHTEQEFFLAVARNQEVGIDCEYINESFDWPSVAEFCFNESEKKHLNSLPAGEQTTSFYSLWTQKEAMLKAYGTGLSDMEKLPSSFTQTYLLVPFLFQHQYIGTAALPKKTSKVCFFNFIFKDACL